MRVTRMSFSKKVIHALHEKYNQDHIFLKEVTNVSNTSAVLFLLGSQSYKKGVSSELCLILNKRSSRVKQPGDLCCPGGSISSRVDSYLAKLLYLPGSPLTRWPFWSQWSKHRHQEARNLSLLFATGLRESFEEMRLNPLGLKFLGPLPLQQLVMFKRVIYPMVCRVPYQKRFFLNWEVDKAIYIPIRNLLNPSNYACYRLHTNMPDENIKKSHHTDYPCFLHEHQNRREILWGATFRITMSFLEIVFQFKPPNIESLPVVIGTLDENYLTGSR